MDFRITEEQELMVQAIEEAMTRENLEPYFQDCDKNHTHPEKWWEILKELGCFSMFLPEEAEGEDGEPGGGEGAVTMFLVCRKPPSQDSRQPCQALLRFAAAGCILQHAHFCWVLRS